MVGSGAYLDPDNLPMRDAAMLRAQSAALRDTLADLRAATKQLQAEALAVRDSAQRIRHHTKLLLGARTRG